MRAASAACASWVCKRARFDQASGGLRPATLLREIAGRRGEVARLAGRLAPAMERRLRRAQDALNQQARVLQSVSYERVLARGFALVTRADGALVRAAVGVADGDALRLRFADGEVAATAGASGPVAPRPESALEQPQRPRIRRRTRGGDDQGNLF